MQPTIIFACVLATLSCAQLNSLIVSCIGMCTRSRTRLPICNIQANVTQWTLNHINVMYFQVFLVKNVSK